MVKLRLAKQGRKKLPIYKIIAADSRSRRDGRFIESLGQYRPSNESNKIVDLKEDRIMYWLKVGAQPSATVRSLLSREGILLKWHLEKKNVDAARASEIFSKWKSDKESASVRRASDKENAARRKKEAEAKALAEAQAAAAVAAQATAVTEEAAPEAPTEETAAAEPTAAE